MTVIADNRVINRLVLVLWEKRWHGFACWSIEHKETRFNQSGIQITRTIATGWWRPPRGWIWQEIELRDFDDIPIRWDGKQLRGSHNYA